MVTEKNNRCFKAYLPNGKVVDILSPVLDEIIKWIQDDNQMPESGGYIVGYQHKETGNVSLEEVSHPYNLDVKNRIRFDIRDPRHNIFLRKAQRKKSFYMGVWHTHPQAVPEPSSIDWNDWNETLLTDKTGCQYIFFVIAGTQQWRLWVGDTSSGKISECSECEKDTEGIYIRKEAEM